MKKTIGRIDKVDFPSLHLSEIDIKIDTGAYTSSIHCTEIEEISNDGEDSIKFILLDPDHPHYNKKEFVVKHYNKKTVKSSNGQTEERFAIKTDIKLFDEIFPITLTLTERSDMKYPVLIGRKFLTKKFIVDTAKKNVSYKLKEVK